MISIKAHINNVALHHTIFDLPFAFMGAVLAANGHPRLIDLFWIAMAITTGRAAAMAIDNLADLKYDKQQPRMAYRAMVAGRISKREALVFIVICLVLMVLSVLQLQPICIYLLPVAAIPFIIYPFMKRVTGWV
ncbi:UbiA family prenyltransferase, partial [Mitsuokella multacida]